MVLCSNQAAYNSLLKLEGKQTGAICSTFLSVFSIDCILISAIHSLFKNTLEKVEAVILHKKFK